MVCHSCTNDTSFLQAHIDHRHVKISARDDPASLPQSVERLSVRDPRAPSSAVAQGSHSIPVMTSSRAATNLITIPILDQKQESPAPPHSTPQSYISTSLPPPIITPPVSVTFSNPPPNLPPQPSPIYPPLSSSSGSPYTPTPPPGGFTFPTATPPSHSPFTPPPNIPPPTNRPPPPQNYSRPPNCYDWGAPPPSANYYRWDPSLCLLIHGSLFLLRYIL